MFLVLLGLVLLAAVPVAAEGPVVQDVLDILKDRGLVDEGQYTSLSARNQSYEEEQQGLLGRIEWSGDFRGRFESYWYDRDETGNRRDNRNRLRYRLRLQGKAEINEYIDITDGITNRAGWHVYGKREVLPNTDLSVELLWDQPIRTSLPDFDNSVPNPERVRLRTDVIVKF